MGIKWKKLRKTPPQSGHDFIQKLWNNNIYINLNKNYN